jgi:hypothetical protein
MVQAQETILLAQDTVSLNYNTRVKTEGIGYIGDKTLGVNTRACLAVTAGGLVLGAADQRPHNREEAKGERRTRESKKARPLEEKESYRWIKTPERERRRYTGGGANGQRMRPGGGYGGLKPGELFDAAGRALVFGADSPKPHDG